MAVVYTNPVTYTTVPKTGSDGDIVAAPGSGHFLRVHFIFANNADDLDVEFELKEGSTGTTRFRMFVANYGGAIAMHLPNPWDLPENTSLYYNWIAGVSADLLLTIGYEDIEG